MIAIKIYYDTEFLEDGRTIELISIGMVAEDGRELYAVNAEMPFDRVVRHDWLHDNVVPSLPITPCPPGHRCYSKGRGHLDADHPDVRPSMQIARMVESFILATPEPELWAYYGAYDHVALAQLFGRMIDLPQGVPMFTCDLKQEAVRLGNPHLPEQAEGEHNALADAHHNWVIAKFLQQVAKEAAR